MCAGRVSNIQHQFVFPENLAVQVDREIQLSELHAECVTVSSAVLEAVAQEELPCQINIEGVRRRED